MLDLCRIIFGIVVDLFRPRAALEAEILVLRQQIIELRRGRPSRVPFHAVDKMVLGWVCQLFPKTREALAIVRPDTVVRWHRAGFRWFAPCLELALLIPLSIGTAWVQKRARKASTDKQWHSVGAHVTEKGGTDRFPCGHQTNVERVMEATGRSGTGQHKS